MKIFLFILGAVLMFPFNSLYTQQLTAYEIVKKSDDKLRGEENGYSVMSMEIVRPTWNRIITFKSWNMSDGFSMVLITDPAKEKGQSFLKISNEMWNWNPSINRIIKMPASMLAQGWMGSDFTNDDLLNQSSMVTDYTHSLSGKESISGYSCDVIELIPLEDAPVVWGKIKLWISENSFLQLKAEYYDEDGYLVKTETAYEIKTIDGRNIPTRFELIPADKPGNKTIVTILEAQFNISLQESFFSQQNMQKLR